LWSYQLPGIVDENNAEFSVVADLDKQSLAYNPALNTLSQIRALPRDKDFNVKFTLSDSLGLSKTFAMRVSFICKKETPEPVMKTDTAASS